jgi:hypothetical protein
MEHLVKLRVAISNSSFTPFGDLMPASRNLLVTIIVLLAAGLAVAAYMIYEEKKQPDGVEIKIGESGISIEGK